jgi:nitroreductase
MKKNENLSPEVAQIRHPNYPILPMFLNRWSPRSMTGEGMSDEELMPLFEAARWAPSSYNAQPWRFLYAKRETPEWQTFFNLLVQPNQMWAKNASVLILVISHNVFEHNGTPSVTHSFDAGSAWMSLALEANSRGYITHGMEGFDYAKAKTALNIPDDYTVNAMIAVGKRGPKENLPPEFQAREKPNDRKPLNEIIMEGKWLGPQSKK